LEFCKHAYKALNNEFTGNWTVTRPRFKWEESVKDVARLLCCRNWQLTMHNRTVWAQILWEAKAQ
jgi:hypothetical protein